MKVKTIISKKALLKFVLNKHFGIQYYDLIHNHLLTSSYNNSHLKELMIHYEKEFLKNNNNKNNLK